ncbi:MAG: TrpR like protein, YerC/YecD [Parcubacteria group bacterium Greene0714_7]|nr:MAG: TrpR like protein, YerC/YecD [Parcubacteria group bacterium Greene0714_7]
MKVKPKKLTKDQIIETLDALYTAAGSLRGRATMKLFLRDLLTEGERVMLGRRILIARHLLRGESYISIQRTLGTSPVTIRNVEKWLDDQMPGYETAIKGMQATFAKRKQKSASIGTFAYLKKRYPLHFLLFPWPKGYRTEDQ